MTHSIWLTCPRCPGGWLVLAWENGDEDGTRSTLEEIGGWYVQHRHHLRAEPPLHGSTPPWRYADYHCRADPAGSGLPVSEKALRDGPCRICGSWLH